MAATVSTDIANVALSDTLKENKEPCLNVEVENGTEHSNEKTSDPREGLHVLQNKWAMWFFKNDRSRSWTDNLKEVCQFETVEDFWGIINNIAPPSKLPIGCDYYLFKTGIKPMWEDATNLDGGSWLITIEKHQRSTHLDPFWIEVLMMLIGEAFFDDSDEICGAVVNVRGKVDRISIWTRNCETQAAVLRIGHKIKETLSLKIPIQYQSHENAQNKQGSKAKSTYQI